MHVLFLTHYYPPEVGAPQTRISALAAGLAARGVKVAVHAPPPHYPGGRIRAGHRNRPFSRGHENGIEVFRSAVYPAPNRGFARRLADHASFGATAIATAPRTAPADVVVAETPPLFTAAAAIAYARRKAARLVLNVADLWPDSAIELGALRSGAAIRAARALERRCYRAAAVIACPTKGIAERLAGHPDAAGKVRRIASAVDLADFDPSPADREGPFRVLYAGTTGLAQGVGTLLEAAARLDSGAEIEIEIAGGGAEQAELARRARDLPSVRVLGSVPREEVPRMLSGASAAVVLLRDRPVLQGALPTKMLEAMAAARPVVISAAGEATRFVEDAGAGIAVPPEDPAALARALEELATDRERAARLGADGRTRVEAEHGLDRFVGDWLELLDSVPTSGRSRAG